MANEAKQFTIGGVTHDVMDVGARQAIASLQAAIDAITSGDTTTAIKTFQEVIDFLDGVTDDATLIGKLNELRTLIAAKYSKPASGIPASDLADGVIPDVSGFATKTEVNAKANSADVVPNSRTVNGKALSSNVTIGMNDIQGLVEAIANAGSGAVSVTTNQDGTFVIHVGETDYTINLNHTHENMARLVVCEESDLPSTLDPATIYAQVNDASNPTEIEVLYIAGLEFAGGGGAPSTDPRIVAPIGTQLDFNGESTKTITVKAVNLSEALTIAVTGMTANLQSISVNDAAAGVQLILTKGQDFAIGTLRIYSSEVDKSWNVIDNTLPAFIRGVKLNGAQWLKTDYVPNNNTSLEITFKLTQTSLTVNSSDRFFMRTAGNGANSFLIFPFGEIGNQKWGTIIDTQDSTSKSSNVISSTYFYADNAKIRLENGTCTYTAGGQSFQIGTGIVVPTLLAPITICGRLNNQGVEKIYNYTDVNIYEFKIWESGTLVKHYKPAIYQGVIGLYDVVNDDFISSESSTSLIALE